MSREATARACSNIALVKYWGKRDARLNLPARGSFSLTLAGLTTTTTVRWVDEPQHTLSIGGVATDTASLGKAGRVLDLVRSLAGTSASAAVTSTNDFPTGAGLASSASGLAALTLAATRAAGLELDRAALSRLARIGSGSACRSLFGGFVEWQAGVRDDGEDSIAVPVFGPEHWDLRVVVAVVSDRRKAVNSTNGMEHTRETSPFHVPYLDTVDNDLREAKRAVEERDLVGLGRVAERSCLRMHAAMMGADPALVYLRPETWQVLDAVHALRASGVPLFFTIDAGPNVKVFTLPAAVDTIREALLELPAVGRLIVASPGPAAECLGAR